MYLSCQLSFKTPRETPTEISAAAGKSNICKHDRMYVFTTDIH